MNLTPYSAASALARSSAVTIVMRSAGERDVTQDQRQHSLTDAAETDHDQAAGELEMHGILGMHTHERMANSNVGLDSETLTTRGVY